MSSEHEASLGEGNYRWIRILAAAAAGDYAAADEDLAYLAGTGQGGMLSTFVTAWHWRSARPSSTTVRGSGSRSPPWAPRLFGRLEFSSRVRSGVQTLSQRADVTTLRGLLALEVGAGR